LTATVTIREATASDRAALEDFYLGHHPDGKRIVEVRQWHEADMDASGGNRSAVAVFNGTICGVVNSVPSLLACSGVTMRGVWLRDSFVLPAFRGQGIAKRLVVAAAGDAPIVMGKGTTAAMYRVHQSLGFIDLPRANFLVRVLQPVVAGSAKRRVACAWLYARAAIRRAPRCSRGIAVGPITDFDEAFETVTSRLQACGEVRPVKTRQYLRWRYLTAPGRRYALFRADGAAGCEGAAVLRLNEAPRTDAWLVDLVTDPSEAAASALIDACLDAARASGAGYVMAFATSPAVRKGLAARGFFGVPITPRFTCWVRQAPPVPDVAVRAWDIWHGDGDTELYW
jgi:GNAT superfamily N-acetyltransferase